ncbi:MAG: thioredoxin family protein [Methanomassiliicoccales archaeon]|nr:thioredoxin family protein [Methanomassiliicoccales archaeon]
MANRIKLTIFSVSCCHPQTAIYDKQFVDRLRQVLQETGLEADLDLVTATEAQLSIQYYFISEIMPMFKKYGPVVAPALFVNERLALFGGVPTVEKLKEVLTQAASEPRLLF